MAAMSATGTLTATSGFAADSASTIVTGRDPPRKSATVRAGETVADRPIRWAGSSSSPSRRSRDSARWVPRLLPAREWISSTMTVETAPSVFLASLVSMR